MKDLGAEYRGLVVRWDIAYQRTFVEAQMTPEIDTDYGAFFVPKASIGTTALLVNVNWRSTS